MHFNPAGKTTSQPATLQFRMNMGARLRRWLDVWRERRLQVRGTALTAELNGHLLRDIGYEDVPPERGRLSGRCEAGIRAFNMRLLRRP